MLSQLHIVNFALVESISLDFNPGMTVITGETGAGKSILLDALSLALGARTDSSCVRHGCKKAEINASFDLSQNTAAKAWLDEHDLNDTEDWCHIRRCISAEGRSKAYVNGRPVSLGELKQLAQTLAEIHGQHGHQALLNNEQQRLLVDRYGTLQSHAASVKTLANNWNKKHQTLLKLTATPDEGLAKQQLLRYQINELEELDLQEGELEELEQSLNTLSHAQELIEGGQAALNTLEDDHTGAQAQLHRALTAIEQLPVRSTTIEQAIELLNSAIIHTDEAVSELALHCNSVDLDPNRMNQIEQRLNHIYDIARKHRIEARAVLAHQAQLNSELAALEGIDEQVTHLEAELSNIYNHYQSAAQKLASAREKAAKKLCRKVNSQFTILGMNDAQLDIAWQPTNATSPQPGGLHTAHFQVRTNAGQPFGDIKKVASGGELSRISLAIQVATAELTTIPTLLFDEVDVGVGGSTASKIGRLMRSLGENLQVLSVTHQPQVAAQSHHHWHVSKHSKNNKTVSTLQILNNEDRTLELARMLGGEEIHSESIENAKALINEALH